MENIPAENEVENRRILTYAFCGITTGKFRMQDVTINQDALPYNGGVITRTYLLPHYSPKHIPSMCFLKCVGRFRLDFKECLEARA